MSCSTKSSPASARCPHRPDQAVPAPNPIRNHATRGDARALEVPTPEPKYNKIIPKHGRDRLPGIRGFGSESSRPTRSAGGPWRGAHWLRSRRAYCPPPSSSRAGDARLRAAWECFRNGCGRAACRAQADWSVRWPTAGPTSRCRTFAAGCGSGPSRWSWPGACRRVIGFALSGVAVVVARLKWAQAQAKAGAGGAGTARRGGREVVAAVDVRAMR
jgi:hypothetical protein